jgi:ABC-type multidrug transport system ATPase subunit
LVIQTEYGISRSWYWPFIAPFSRFRRRKMDTENKDLEAARMENLPIVEKTPSTQTSESIQSDSQTLDDIATERDRVLSGSANSSALLISQAKKRFGSKYAVNDVTLAISHGEILALLGPNGAGKTTLINCVLGLYRLSSGNAFVNGFDITHQQEFVYRFVGICPQHEILWPDLTCEEHLLFYARLKGIDPKEEKNVVRELLEQVELVPEKDKLSKQISGGQKRRLSIAIALVARPAVVFLDEPTTGNFIEMTADVGLDPNVKRSLWRVIKRVKEMYNMCIILTTHSMYVAFNDND